jgi:hypothetical protein
MRQSAGRQGQSRGQGNKRRRSARLGVADYTHQGPIPYAQMLFLRAVSRCVPGAIAALAELAPSFSVDEPPMLNPQMQAWAERWGFGDPWAMRSAHSHAMYWRDNPDNLGKWLVVSHAAWEPVFPPLSAWNPLTESEASFRARVESYIEVMKQAPGLTRTPERPDGADHFEWLALHHVAGWRLEDIAEKYQDAGGLEPGSISEAISRTAVLAGVTLRSKAGRTKLRTTI